MNLFKIPSFSDSAQYLIEIKCGNFAEISTLLFIISLLHDEMKDERNYL